MATLQEILGGLGGGLQAFSAGVQGQGQQFLQNRETQLQNLSTERKQALLEDAVDVLGRLERGDEQGAIGVLDSRLEALGGDPNADSSDTQEIKDLITSGNTQQAIAELQGLEQRAVRFGRLKPRPGAAETFSEVLGPQGNIVGQRSTTTGRVVTDPRATKAATPSTAIGKARADLKAGFITQGDLKTITSTPAKFQTDVGKLISDKNLATQMFGEDSEQVKAINEAIQSSKKGEVKLSDVGGVRKEFTKLSSDFIQLRDAIGKIKVSADNPSAAGDLAMIFNFMKMLDPGSVVREGEFATAQNAAGVPDQIKNQYNRIISGERLNEKQRADFVNTADGIFQKQTATQRGLETSFRAIAERQGIDPANVVIDFVGGGTPEDKPISEMTDEELRALAGQ